MQANKARKSSERGQKWGVLDWSQDLNEQRVNKEESGWQAVENCEGSEANGWTLPGPWDPLPTEDWDPVDLGEWEPFEMGEWSVVEWSIADWEIRPFARESAGRTAKKLQR